ncbi:winged helix-turn-helix domain-containing protein [Pseudoroseomonas wenyumeiae]
MSRDQLLAASRGSDQDVYDRSIDVTILRLRRKLEQDVSQPSLIRTERGLGYVFTAPVEVQRESAPLQASRGRRSASWIDPAADRQPGTAQHRRGPSPPFDCTNHGSNVPGTASPLSGSANWPWIMSSLWRKRSATSCMAPRGSLWHWPSACPVVARLTPLPRRLDRDLAVSGDGTRSQRDHEMLD